jgi:eukaryotic-like serine/threonine-protein kinase
MGLNERDLDRAAESAFAEALSQDTPETRAACIERACAGDSELRHWVEALLLAHAEAGAFLDHPPAALETAATITGTDDGAVEEEGPGTVIGRYKLLERIGEGGMGVVFMAQQVEPVRRKVALKVIKAGMDSRQIVARFEAERQALAMMDHPNIARVLDGGTTRAGRPYFVMELVQGVPVTEFCDQNRLAARQRLELFVRVCQAVQHAHTKGVIHRDLKPNNVLVTLADGVPVPKVIDFGIAKATGQELTEKTLFTQFAQMIGTPLYMSPEQAGGGADVDTRSDVYSLGVLLYELLTGTTPFDRGRLGGVAFEEVRRIIRDEDPPKPSTRISTLGAALAEVSARRATEPRRLRQLVRGELDWIVMRALEKDRNRRYESANGLVLDVQRYLANEAVHACPPSTSYRFRKYARRNRVTLLTAASIVAVLLVATVVSVWQAGRARTAAWAARRAAAELALDKGQLLGESGDANLALLWLARGLTLAPPDATDLQSALRAGMAGWRTRVNAVDWVVPHVGRVISAGFDRVGRPFTVCYGEDYTSATARLWDAAGVPHAQPPVPIDPKTMIDIAVSPTGDRLALLSSDEVLRLADLSTGRILWEVGGAGASAGAGFSPDGKLLLAGFTNGPVTAYRQTGRAQLYDAATGRPRGPSLDHPRPVWGAAFHPDGKSFVTTCGTWGDAVEKTAARFFDLEGRPTRPPLEMPCMALTVAFDPGGTKLLAGHWDRTARLWDLSAPAGTAPVKMQHEGPVCSVSYSADGRTLMTGSFDGSVRLWDADGKPLGVPLRQGQMLQWSDISRDGARVIARGRGNDVRLWELAVAGGGPARPRPGAPWPLAVSPDGRTYLAQDADLAVRVRDAAGGQPIGAPLPHVLPVRLGGSSLMPGRRAACSSDRRRALTLERDEVARLWDVETGRVVAEIKGEEEWALVFAAAFSPDSRFLVTGHFGRQVCVWDAETGKRLRTMEHDIFTAVFDLDFLPDGRTLLTAGADGAVRVWDVETGEPSGEPFFANSPVFAVAVSPDGRTAVLGDTDRNVQLWDVPTRRRRFHLSGHTGGIHDIAFSADGRFIVTGSRDGTARLWDAATGKPVGPPMVHAAPVIHVGFGEDGRTVRTALHDQSSHEWPIASPLAGAAANVETWAQFTTGMELGPDGGVQILESQHWEQRRRALEGSGLPGAPLRAAQALGSRPATNPSRQ